MGCSNGSEGFNRSISPRRTEIKHGDSIMIKKKYIITNKVLGAGNFGKVFLAHNAANPKLQVAIKSIDKKKVNGKLDAIKEEIKILSRLDHPNIIKYYETFESPNFIYLVSELCRGGELFDYITQREGEMTEADCAKLIKKVI
jgi:serine/threonine protein kinase